MLATMFVVSLCIFAAYNCLTETGDNPKAYNIPRSGRWYEKKNAEKGITNSISQFS